MKQRSIAAPVAWLFMGAVLAALVSYGTSGNVLGWAPLDDSDADHGEPPTADLAGPALAADRIAPPGDQVPPPELPRVGDPGGAPLTPLDTLLGGAVPEAAPPLPFELPSYYEPTLENYKRGFTVSIGRAGGYGVDEIEDLLFGLEVASPPHVEMLRHAVERWGRHGYPACQEGQECACEPPTVAEALGWTEEGLERVGALVWQQEGAQELFARLTHSQLAKVLATEAAQANPRYLGEVSQLEMEQVRLRRELWSLGGDSAADLLFLDTLDRIAVSHP